MRRAGEIHVTAELLRLSLGLPENVTIRHVEYQPWLNIFRMLLEGEGVPVVPENQEPIVVKFDELKQLRRQEIIAEEREVCIATLRAQPQIDLHAGQWEGYRLGQRFVIDTEQAVAAIRARP